MAKPDGFRSYLVKLILAEPHDEKRPIRSVLLAVVASGVETAIQAVRETYGSPEEWRVEYVREGVIQ